MTRPVEQWGLGFRSYLLMIAVGLIGIVSAAFVLAFGLTSAYHDQRVSFDTTADDLISQFEKALDEYSVAGLWIHEACRKGDKSREDFRTLYQYLLSTGLEFQAVSFAMNVSHDERPVLEKSTREFLNSSTYNSVEYHGISGFELDPGTGSLVLVPRSEQQYYQAIHYIEPLENKKNQAALDFDLRTSDLRWTAVVQAFETHRPAVTERLKLIQETQDGTETYAYSVILMHPGMPEIVSQDVAVIALRIPELLSRAHMSFAHTKSLQLYVFDSSESNKPPSFLGGAWLHHSKTGERCESGGYIEHKLTFQEEVELIDIYRRDTRYSVTRDLKIASRQWTFVVLAENEAYDPDIFFVVLGSCAIVVLTISLLIWIRSRSYREARLNGFRAQAEAEKAALLIQSAESTANAQRELNDFIAHEVRNPLSAAISACCFVNSQVQSEEPLSDKKIWDEIKEDVGTIGGSLQFINDLLRDMLDMNRASSNQLKIEKCHVDILKDVLEPVSAMLYSRGGSFEVHVECPENLVVESDRLRLKQIVMNLGRNAAKFVTRGFIRLRACVENAHVRIMVEDSGPGIPDEKKETLFAKYQESLDILNQGTGIGLSLSSKLVGLLGGELWLSPNYQSGLDGCPGASFVIDLKVAPVPESLSGSQIRKEVEDCDSLGLKESTADLEMGMANMLPKSFSVLLVDDTYVLRKLYARSLKKVAPGWKITEAANGETALHILEKESFDLMFVDQYMASGKFFSIFSLNLDFSSSNTYIPSQSISNCLGRKQ